MEGKAVIKTSVGQVHEVLHRDRGGVSVHLHGDGAVVLNLDLGVVGANALRFLVRGRGF